MLQVKHTKFLDEINDGGFHLNFSNNFFLLIFSLIFRNVLYKAKELGLRTIGLCTISSVKKNFPADLGAHIALSKNHQILYRK